MPQEQSPARYEAELKTLMKLAFILDAAGEGVLGKGAPAMMYQAGRDAGREQGGRLGRTDDLGEALALVLSEGDEVWRFERWLDPGQEDEWVQGPGGKRTTCILFRRCPLLTLARRVGSSPGGLLCQALHGYVAGSMERIMDNRIDMRVGHCGPRACKIHLEMRS